MTGGTFLQWLFGTCLGASVRKHSVAAALTHTGIPALGGSKGELGKQKTALDS